MNPAGYILNRLILLVIHNEASDRSSWMLYRLRRKRDKVLVEQKETIDPDKLASMKLHEPVLLRFSGYGIVSKTLSASEIVARVTADPHTFVWTEEVSTDRFVFARREQIAPALEKLSSAGILPVGIEYAVESDETEIVRSVERFGTERLHIRKLLHPTPENARLLTLFCRRLRLPLLGAVLLLLIVNTLVYGSFQDRCAVLQETIALQREKQGTMRDFSERRRQLVETFDRRLPFRHAILADRIASHVPPAVTLTSLAVQPLVRAIETEKDPVLMSGILSIKGSTADPSAVSQMIAGLKTEPFAEVMTLTRMEQNRESGMTEFEITIEL